MYDDEQDRYYREEEERRLSEEEEQRLVDDYWRYENNLSDDDGEDNAMIIRWMFKLYVLGAPLSMLTYDLISLYSKVNIVLWGGVALVMLTIFPFITKTIAKIVSIIISKYENIFVMIIAFIALYAIVDFAIFNIGAFLLPEHKGFQEMIQKYYDVFSWLFSEKSMDK